MLLWGDVSGFLESADVAPKSCEKLKCLLESDLTNLLIELAVTIDAGEAFVKACYTLEGDGHQSRFNTGQHTCCCIPVSFPTA